MSGRLTAALLALACCAAVCGCGKGKGDGGAASGGGAPGAGVDAVVRELNEFTDELERAVESAQSPQDGVAAAQKLLDARRPALAARVSAFKASPQFQGEAEAKRKWLEAEVDDTDRVSRLQVKYMDTKMRDPDFKARLDRVVEDYNSIFRDSAPR